MVDVINTDNDPTLPGSIPFQMDMLTVPNLSEELMSVGSFYAKQGYEVPLTHASKGGHPHMRKGVRMRKLPVRCDYLNKGFVVGYIPKQTTIVAQVSTAGTSNPRAYVEKATLAKQTEAAVLNNLHAGLNNITTHPEVWKCSGTMRSAKAASHLHIRCLDSPVVTSKVSIVPGILPSTARRSSVPWS